MQDNAPCNKAKTVMSYLSQQNFEVIDLPAQSIDLNSIENLWKTLGDMARKPTNTENLWVKLQEEWSKTRRQTRQSSRFLIKHTVVKIFLV